MKEGKEKREKKINKGKNKVKILYSGEKIYFTLFFTVLRGKNIILEKGGGEEYNVLGKYIPLSIRRDEDDYYENILWPKT